MPSIDIQRGVENHWPPDGRAWQAQTLLRAAMPPPTASATLVIQVLLAGRARPARQAHTRHSRAQELVAAALWVCGSLQSPEVENGLKPSDMCDRESRQAPTRRRAVTPPRTALAMWATLALLEVHARRARPARTRHSRAQEPAAAARRVWVPKTNNNAQCTQYWAVAYVNLEIQTSSAVK